MTDIVERLEAHASFLAVDYDNPEVAEAMFEASAEIRRLREQCGTEAMTTPNDLTALSARMQEAQAEEQRELLEAAWCAVFGEPVARELLIISMLDPHYHRLIKMLDAGAYESAALMLLAPRTMWATGTMEDGPFARLLWPSQDGLGFDYYEAHAQTPALAIASAALLAHVENSHD